MGAQAGPPIIVIRRKKGGHGGHHGGAWKVAYADFVTAMMALFIVLWLLSSSEKVKKAVESYFQDPTGTGKLAGTTLTGKGEGLMVKPQDMAKLKDTIYQAMRQLPKFDQLKSNIEMTVTNEGLRIELLETEKGLFFDSGSSKLSPRGDEILRLLACQLKLLPNKLLIEGHTDAKPYSSDTGYTNWELSADRANMARRVVQDAGVSMDQIAQVRGFADRHLRRPNDPMDPNNRRVSVIVQYLEASLAAAAKPGVEPDEKAAKDQRPKQQSANTPDFPKPGRKDTTNAAGSGRNTSPAAQQPAAHHW
jgi:chemotaxis protein MotB